MRKVVVVLGVVCITALFFVINNASAVRTHQVRTDGRTMARTRNARATRTTNPTVVAYQQPSVSKASPNDEFVIEPASSAATGNRFDRGRLDEEFDGAFPNRPTAAPITNGAPPTPTNVALNNDDNLDPFGKRTFPASAFPGQNSRPRISDDDLEVVSPPAASSAPAVSNRVTLIIGADHQIRVVAENKLNPSTPPADGTLLVTAEEFTLTPSKEPGGGNQLNCVGNVTIRHQQFIGQGAQFSIDKTNLVLQGTPQQSAVITKLAPSHSDQAAASTDTSEFRLGARRITFTLSLDKLQVDNNTTITPSNTDPPAQPTTRGSSNDATPPVQSPNEADPAGAFPALPKVPENPT